ncbi:MAG: hypothetical protein ACFFC7_23075 [Candidatus Hermodarchaeota archaeon]
MEIPQLKIIKDKRSKRGDDEDRNLRRYFIVELTRLEMLRKRADYDSDRFQIYLNTRITQTGRTFRDWPLREEVRWPNLGYFLLTKNRTLRIEEPFNRIIYMGLAHLGDRFKVEITINDYDPSFLFCWN